MTDVPPSSSGIPEPADGDDDDVAWALQTAAVQWKRGSMADAVVWLKRAVESAMAAGQSWRATELSSAATLLGEQLIDRLSSTSIPPPAPHVAPPLSASDDDVDGLLGADSMPSAGLEATAESSPSSDSLSFDPMQPDIGARVSADRISVEPEPISVEPDAPHAGIRATFDSVTDSLPPALRAPAPASASEPRRPPGPPPRPTAPAPAPAAEVTPEAEAGPKIEPAIPSDPGLAEAVISARVPDKLPFELDELTEPRAARPLSALPPPPRPPPSLRPGRPASPFAAVAGSKSLPPQPAKSAAPPAPSTRASTAASIAAAAAAPVPAPEASTTSLGGVALGSVRGLEDLPEDSQVALKNRAEIVRLARDEEAGSFAVALVLKGAVAILPAIADLACARAVTGDVVFTVGSLGGGIALRVVATEDETEVALWDREVLEAATSDCPWVADELRTVADRFQALAGATMGVLGDRLDDVMFEQVTRRCTLKTLLGGDALMAVGSEVAGMNIVGAGRLELLDGDQVVDELGPGDIVFPSEVMSHACAPHAVRAGAGGALVLFADRKEAHGLFLSVPPLLEILSG